MPCMHYLLLSKLCYVSFCVYSSSWRRRVVNLPSPHLPSSAPLLTAITPKHYHHQHHYYECANPGLILPSPTSLLRVRQPRSSISLNLSNAIMLRVAYQHHHPPYSVIYLYYSLNTPSYFNAADSYHIASRVL